MPPRPIVVFTLALWMANYVCFAIFFSVKAASYTADDAIVEGLSLLIGLTLCFAADQIFRRLGAPLIATWTRIATASAAAMAIVWTVFTVTIAHLFDHDLAALSLRRYVLDCLIDLTEPAWIYVAWICGWSAITYRQETVRRDIALARAALNEAEARHEQLRYRLQPQFVFNALHTISTLIFERDRSGAEAILGSLAKFLRVSLSRSLQDKVTVRDELDAENQYLAIEQLRFGDMLKVTCVARTQAQSCLTPSLILQPLIENAIQFAVMRSSRPVQLHIEATVKDSRLRLLVRDDGRDLPVAEATREAGLTDLGQRLALLYGRRATLTARPRLGGGFEASIEMPEEHL